MTAQRGEIILVNGRTTSMSFCPPLPKNHPRITRSRPEECDERDEIMIGGTNCWRGYVGTWEIREGKFYLVRLQGALRLRGDGSLLADWFSGVLRIPQGELLLYVHMGFGSVFEEELHLMVEKGTVVAERVIDNRAKYRDELALGVRNLPGGENRFDGDDIPF